MQLLGDFVDLQQGCPRRVDLGDGRGCGAVGACVRSLRVDRLLAGFLLLWVTLLLLWVTLLLPASAETTAAAVATGKV